MNSYPRVSELLRSRGRRSAASLTPCRRGYQPGAPGAWGWLRLEWQRGIAALNSQWPEWKAFFLSIVTEAKINAAILFTDIWAGMQTGWFEALDLMRDGWAVFTDSLQNIWANTQSFLAKGIIDLLALFDNTVDAAAAKAIIDEDTGRDIARRDEARGAAILARQEERQRRLDQIEQERLAAREALEQQRTAEQQAIDEQRRKALEQSQGELDAARKRWTDSLAAAANARTEADAAGNSLPQKFAAMVDNLSETAAVALERATTGTFFGRGAEQIFGGGDRATDIARRTLQINQQQLEEQRKTRKAVEETKLVFGP